MANIEAVVWFSTGITPRNKLKNISLSMIWEWNIRVVHTDISSAVCHNTNAATDLLIGIWLLIMYMARRIAPGSTWLEAAGMICVMNCVENTIEKALYNIPRNFDIGGPCI